MAHHYNREILYKLPHIRESTYMKGLREGKRVRILKTLYGSVAQSVEQRTENPCVGGSIPSRATSYARFIRAIFGYK